MSSKRYSHHSSELSALLGRFRISNALTFATISTALALACGGRTSDDGTADVAVADSGRDSRSEDDPCRDRCDARSDALESTSCSHNYGNRGCVGGCRAHRSAYPKCIDQHDAWTICEFIDNPAVCSEQDGHIFNPPPECSRLEDVWDECVAAAGVPCVTFDMPIVGTERRCEDQLPATFLPVIRVEFVTVDQVAMVAQVADQSECNGESWYQIFQQMHLCPALCTTLTSDENSFIRVTQGECVEPTPSR